MSRLLAVSSRHRHTADQIAELPAVQFPGRFDALVDAINLRTQRTGGVPTIGQHPLQLVLAQTTLMQFAPHTLQPGDVQPGVLALGRSEWALQPIGARLTFGQVNSTYFPHQSAIAQPKSEV